jgi:hypothetical protein
MGPCLYEDSSHHQGYLWSHSIIMKIVIFWNIAPCNPYISRRFGRMQVGSA